MILGLAAEPIGQRDERSMLDAFLGVEPRYLQKKLDALELLMWLSTAAGLASAITVAIKLRQR